MPDQASSKPVSKVQAPEAIATSFSKKGVSVTALTIVVDVNSTILALPNPLLASIY